MSTPRLVALTAPASDLDAAELGHLDIEHGHIGLVLLDQGLRLFTVSASATTRRSPAPSANWRMQSGPCDVVGSRTVIFSLVRPKDLSRCGNENQVTPTPARTPDTKRAQELRIRVRRRVGQRETGVGKAQQQLFESRKRARARQDR